MPENEGCRRLSVEGYGGMIMASWLDRPLTVGGRVLVKTQDGVQSRLVYIDRDLLVIPSLAIHFQRDVNKGKVFNPQIDMQPLWGPAGSRTLTDLVCEELGITARISSTGICSLSPGRPPCRSAPTTNISWLRASTIWSAPPQRCSRFGCLRRGRQRLRPRLGHV